MKAVIEVIRRLGAMDAALMITARALARLSGNRAQLFKYYFMAQPVPRAPVRASRSSGIVVSELTRGDPRLAQMNRTRDELARRFDGAARCFAACQGDTLAGFLWFTERQYEEDEVRCTFRVHPDDRAVWDLDVHIEPRYRLGRTFALLWEAAFAAMRARGVRWSISRVSAFKSESMRAHQRLGARPTGWMVFVLLGSIQFTLDSLGNFKCRRLEQRPYPVVEVRAPAASDEADAAGLEAVPAGGRAGPPHQSTAGDHV